MHKALTVTQALHALKSPLAAKKEFTDGINTRIQMRTDRVAEGKRVESPVGMQGGQMQQAAICMM
jgi:hypothetical protein